MQYLKRRYSDQLLINKASVSYGSPYLKSLWSCSVDFLIFCEFFSFNFYFPFLCEAISQKLLLTQHVSLMGFLTRLKIMVMICCFSLFVNFSISPLTLICGTTGSHSTYLCLKAYFQILRKIL